jgi:hypothetical protein
MFSQGYIGVSKNTKARFEQHIIYNSFEDLAIHLGIKYSTLTNRIYRNAVKYGYEVIKCQ